jgi:hypothetical protein
MARHLAAVAALVAVAASAAAAAPAVAAAAPEGPLPPLEAHVWLRPETLARSAGRPLSVWNNSARGGGLGAALDNSICFPRVNCSSAPTVSAAPVAVGNGSSFFVVDFVSPGSLGLGTNLILQGDYSAPSSAFSVFFFARAAARTLLYARNANWLLGTWEDARVSTTYADRAYCDDALGDAGWLANGRAPVAAPGKWATYGFVAFGNGTGCAFRGARALACGPAVGPNVLRLGGGQGGARQARPAAFGTGSVAELVTYERALDAGEVARAAAYFSARYGEER